MTKQNITRKVQTCLNPFCREKYQDLDGSGYCESCEPPEFKYARGAQFVPPEKPE